MVQLEKRRISTFEALFFFRRFSSRLVSFCLLLFSSSTEALKFFFFSFPLSLRLSYTEQVSKGPPPHHSVRVRVCVFVCILSNQTPPRTGRRTTDANEVACLLPLKKAPLYSIPKLRGTCSPTPVSTV